MGSGVAHGEKELAQAACAQECAADVRQAAVMCFGVSGCGAAHLDSRPRSR